MTTKAELRDECAHEWQPVSFVFETQLLDSQGQVRIRQPDIEDGRVYCVCMKCHSHSYIVTRWVGFYIVRDEDLDEDGTDTRFLREPRDQRGALDD